MKYIKKIGVVLCCICMLAGILPREAFAASGKVSVSSASGTVGSKVTVKCTISVTGTSIGATDVKLSYNSSALEATSSSDGASAASGGVSYSGYASSEGAKSLSFSVTFKIRKEGSYPISITSAEAWDWDDQAISLTGKSSGSVTGKAVTTSKPATDDKKDDQKDDKKDEKTTTSDNQPESNSRLSSLKVSPGTLSPAFAAGTTEYTVQVSKDTKQVTISAVPESKKATVTVSGGTDLKPGANEAKVIVTAENGSSTVYNLGIVCGTPEKIEIDGKQYSIHKTIQDKLIPTGFIKGQMRYEGALYDAVKHEVGELYMFYLKGEKGSRFFIYDKNDGVFSPFEQIKFSNGNYLIPMPLVTNNQQFVNHEVTTVDLNGQTFEAWKLDEEYSVICAMNKEGRTVMYRYDKVDGTLQRYESGLMMEEPDEGLPDEAEQDKKGNEALDFLEKYHLQVILGLGVVVLALLITLICIAASQQKERHPRRGRRRRRNNKDTE